MKESSWAKDHLVGSWISVPWETKKHAFHEDSDNDSTASEDRATAEDDVVLCVRCRKMFLTDFKWGQTDDQVIVLNTVDGPE